jgi:TatD DNase family protein
MNPEYIDVHAHVNFPDYDADREEVIKRSLDAGVWMINVGTTLQSSKDVVAIAEKYDQGVYAIVGLHPVHVECNHDEATNEVDPVAGEKNSYAHDHEEDFDYDAFEKLVAHPKTVGIGECGIDVFRLDPKYDKDEVLKKQEEVFRKQIELAIRYDKPIMIHARESYSKRMPISSPVPLTRPGRSWIGVLRCHLPGSLPLLRNIRSL